MKALSLEQYKQFKYSDYPDPEFGDKDVLLRVQACGICGSDVHGMDGSSGRRIPPIIMGHEASGVIEKVGDHVTEWKPGDRVTFDSTVFCGECDYCKAGKINLCDNRRVMGVSCDDYRQHGAYAEFVAVPARILFKVPDDLSFEEAAFVEPVSIALHAVSLIPIKGGETAVVVGAGMIGLLVLQALKAAGCERVICVDLDTKKLEMAKELGANEVVISDADAVAKIVAMTDGGADIAMEVVGISATLNLAINSLRKGGKLGAVGNLAAQTEFPLQAVVTRELTIYGSCACNGEYADALKAISAGSIRVRPLMSAVAPLSEGAAWFDRLYAGEEDLLKVILKPDAVF
ncbi:MAG: L-iditol 2-dehydrogenase [Verrucomicrobiales bacterium]|jgi:L-iditol 2-dehydrogenase